MRTLTYTLVADGSSDRCLQYVINWVLKQSTHSAGTLLINSQFADYGDRPNPPKGLPDKLRQAAHDYPCDILFVHRDAEREDPALRRTEILNAASEAGFDPVVCVIPVRMTEAWLLFDESAIRQAAGNPTGRVRLTLPAFQRLEKLPDPKDALEKLLITASEAGGRRLKLFERDLPKLKQRVAELIKDFSPLRRLDAFSSFEQEMKDALSRL